MPERSEFGHVPMRPRLPRMRVTLFKPVTTAWLRQYEFNSSMEVENEVRSFA